jgi:hypothetical protein
MFDYVKEKIYEFDMSKFKSPKYKDILARNAFDELRIAAIHHNA